METDLEDFYEELEELEAEIDHVWKVALLVGDRVVNWLKSTDPKYGEQPPARNVQDTERGSIENPEVVTEGPRVAHPGGWADITGNLANSYDYRLIQFPWGFQLVFLNDADYAAYLDARVGYFVLEGVADSKDGKALVELERALNALLPDWDVNVT